MSGKCRRLRVLEERLIEVGALRPGRSLFENMTFMTAFSAEVDDQLQALLSATPVSGVEMSPRQVGRDYMLLTITRALTTSERTQLLELIQAARAAEELDAL